MKKTILFAVLAAVLIATPVLAAVFQANLTVVESSGTTYTRIGVTTPMNVDWMATNGYMAATGRDTRVVLGSNTYAHMLREGYINFAVPVNGNSTVTYEMTTDNSLADMSIVPGYGGYVTVLDDPALELGNNFEIELTNAYIDTTAGAGKYLLYKQDAIELSVSGAGVITGVIEEGKYTYYDVNDTSNQQVGDNWAGNTWDVAQTFTTTIALDITSLSVLCAKGLAAGVGNSTVSIRLMGATPSTNPALTTGVGNMDVNGWVTFDVADITLLAATQYVIVFDDTAGESYWRYDNAGGYADGNRWTNQNEAGWVEQAGTDLLFRINITPTVTSALATGEYDISLTGDATDFKLFVDSVEVDSDPIIAVANNANNWRLMDNSTTDFMPYLGVYQHTVAGTLIAHYAPAAIIATTVLPDRQGAAQNGVFTFGSNPAGVLIDVGALTLVDIESPEGSSLVSPDYGDDVNLSPDMTAADNELTMPNNEFYAFVSALAVAGRIDVNMLWWWLAACLSIVAVAVGRKFTNNVWVAGLLGAAFSGFFVSMGGVELWIPAYIFIATAFVGVWQRTSDV